jgi:hypothetical protein
VLNCPILDGSSVGLAVIEFTPIAVRYRRNGGVPGEGVETLFHGTDKIDFDCWGSPGFRARRLSTWTDVYTGTAMPAIGTGLAGRCCKAWDRRASVTGCSRFCSVGHCRAIVYRLLEADRGHGAI